ncbi:MAG: AraC family transcriptional regulator [Clostridia bacterium]|nr:AraC family transcriptional regulator [Clostridia bacterium]
MKIFFYRHNKREPMNEIRHKISFYDLTIFIDGECEYIVDGEAIKVSSGDAVLIPPSSYRIRKKLVNADYVSINFYSDEKIDLPIYNKDIVDSSVKHIIASLDYDSTNYSDYSSELFTKLFECLILKIQQKLNTKSLNQTVEKIKKYIDEHIYEKIKLSDIGNYIYLSHIYCDLLFKKETGKSIIDYAIDQKIKKAESMLLEGGAKLSDVAEKIGFIDYNYFSRVFKKRIGYTPSEYRKLYFSSKKDN